MFDSGGRDPQLVAESNDRKTVRELLLGLAAAAVVGGLYLSERVIGPQFATAAAIVVAGEALISVVPATGDQHRD